jgi:hypothetical protein
MAGIIPVSLPISAEEVKFIQRRQGQLVRNMELIDQQVRSGQLSRDEGENRKMFLKGEVVSLERVKKTRRPPTSVSWQPAPRAPQRAPQRATSQASKYTSSATRGSTTTSRGTSARTTSVPAIKTGTAKKVTVRNIPKHIGKSYGSQLSATDKKSSGGYFYGYNFTQGSRKYTIYYGAVNSSTRAITDFRSWCRIHLGKEYTTYQPYKSPAKKVTSAVETAKETVTSWWDKATGGSTKETPSVSKTASTPRKTVRENDYGRSYGTSVSAYEKTVYAGGATPIKYGSYYYGPKYATQRKSWEAWNNKYVYGKAPSTSTRTTTSTSTRKTVKDNPYTYRRTTTGYGTSVSTYEQSLMNYSFKSGNSTMTRSPQAIKVGSYYYGPTHGQEVNWISWMKANKLPYSSGSKSTSTSAPKKTVKDNPYTYNRTSYGYGSSLSKYEKSKLVYGPIYKPKYATPIKQGSYYYGATNGKEEKWLAWNKQYGISGFAGPHHHKHNHRRKQPRRGAGPVIDPATRNRAANLRNQSMAKKKVGANIDTSKPIPGGYAEGKVMKAPRLQNTEIAGIAGGFSKTRNSMQRLLRQ